MLRFAAAKKSVAKPVAAKVETKPAAPITSRFLFVDVAAQRAKQLREQSAVKVAGQPSSEQKKALDLRKALAGRAQ